LIVVYRETCVGDVGVVVTSARYFRAIHIRLSVSDVNDNAPLFNPSSVVLNVSEVCLSVIQSRPYKATQLN